MTDYTNAELGRILVRIEREITDLGEDKVSKDLYDETIRGIRKDVTQIKAQQEADSHARAADRRWVQGQLVATIVAIITFLVNRL